MTFLSLTRTKAPRDTTMVTVSTSTYVFYVTFLMATAVHSAVIKGTQDTTAAAEPMPELPLLDRVGN